MGDRLGHPKSGGLQRQRQESFAEYSGEQLRRRKVNQHEGVGRHSKDCWHAFKSLTALLHEGWRRTENYLGKRKFMRGLELIGTLGISSVDSWESHGAALVPHQVVGE